MVRIERLWSPGDTVELALPMKVVLTARSRGAVAVERGPLVYALKITHVWKKLQERFPAFPDWECRPGSAWNYALCLALEKGPAPRAPVVLAKDPPAELLLHGNAPRECPKAPLPGSFLPLN